MGIMWCLNIHGATIITQYAIYALAEMLLDGVLSYSDPLLAPSQTQMSTWERCQMWNWHGHISSNHCNHKRHRWSKNTGLDSSLTNDTKDSLQLLFPSLPLSSGLSWVEQDMWRIIYQMTMCRPNGRLVCTFQFSSLITILLHIQQPALNRVVCFASINVGE